MQASTQPTTSADINSCKAWLVVLVASLFFFYEFIQGTMFNSMSGELMRDFAIDAEQLGYLSGMHYWSNVLFLFPAGMLLDRFSIKRLIITAMCISVVATFLLALVSNYYLAMFLRFLTGIGAAFCLLSCFRLATRWFPPRRMALVTGIIVTIGMSGGMVAQTPMTWLVEAVGWRQAIMVDALVGMLFIMLIAVFVSDYPVGKKVQLAQEQAQLIRMGFFEGLRRAYCNVQNIAAALYTCLMNAPVGVLGALIGNLFLQQVHGFEATQASIVSTALFLGAIFGCTIIGWISDTIKLRRLPMIVGAIVSLGLFLLVLNAEGWSLTQWIVVCFLIGFTTSTQVISYPTVSESSSPALIATSVSVVSIITQGGIAVMQPLYGRLLKENWDGLYVNDIPLYSANDYANAMLIIPIAFVIALIAAFIVRETHCKQQQS